MIVLNIEHWPNGQRTRAQTIGHVFVSEDYAIKAEEIPNLRLGNDAHYVELKLNHYKPTKSIFHLLSVIFSKVSKSVN